MLKGKQLSLDSRMDLFLGLNQMKSSRPVSEPSPESPIMEINEGNG